jgi:hypothetical protein
LTPTPGKRDGGDANASGRNETRPNVFRREWQQRLQAPDVAHRRPVQLQDCQASVFEVGNVVVAHLKQNIFAFISPFNSQTMHIKSFYTQQHCYVSLKTFYPGGIRTQVFLFMRRMRCPLRHAARAGRMYAVGKKLEKFRYCDDRKCR